jgi:beta-phosphoglucomutase-like phosphatase (HAD superfamily)
MITHFYDWDDVIVLSKNALYLSYKKALSEWNIEFDFTYFNDFIYTDSGDYLSKICNFSKEEIAEVKKKKEFYYLNEFFKDIEFRWPKIEKDDSYYIVTNTSDDLVKRMIDKYDSANGTDFKSKFKILGAYSSDKVLKRKPDAELYTEAFKMWISRMQSGDELHIYEDSAEGLLAAASFLHSHRKRITKFYLHHITY